MSFTWQFDYGIIMLISLALTCTVLFRTKWWSLPTISWVESTHTCWRMWHLCFKCLTQWLQARCVDLSYTSLLCWMWISNNKTKHKLVVANILYKYFIVSFQNRILLLLPDRCSSWRASGFDYLATVVDLSGHWCLSFACGTYDASATSSSHPLLKSRTVYRHFPLLAYVPWLSWKKGSIKWLFLE